MTNEERYLRIKELKYKLYAMPIKTIITIALFVSTMSLDDNKETGYWGL